MVRGRSMEAGRRRDSLPQQWRFASDLRQFKAPAPGRYRFRIAASAHNSETPLPMAVLLGNFVVSGNYSRHLGYFDVPPGEPTIIEFEDRLTARNDTVKMTPVALPFVYLKHETMPQYPGAWLEDSLD